MATGRAPRVSLCERLEPRRLLTAITSNTTVTAAVGSVNEVDSYEFTAAAGDRLIVSAGEGPTAQASFAPRLELKGPGGVLLDEHWDYGSAYVEATAAAAGTYTVLLRDQNSFYTADYRLHLLRLPHAGAV